MFMKTKGRKGSPAGLLPLYSCLLSLLLCMTCLAGTSWAWFTDDATASVDAVTAAAYGFDSISVTTDSPVSPVAALTQGAAAQTVTIELKETEDKTSLTFEARANTPYVLKATLSGTASKGFLRVTTPDGVFYNANGEELKDLSATILLAQSGTVTFNASWGDQYGEGAAEFKNATVLGAGKLLTCSCESYCTETPNGACELCALDIAWCAGCSCAVRCTEASATCPPCAADHTACKGAEVCSCQYQCGEESSEECPVCKTDVSSCTGAVPVCNCQSLCQDASNADCPVCKDIPADCTYRCTCTAPCGETGNESCRVCKEKSADCTYTAPVCTCTVTCGEERNEECPVCKAGDALCPYKAPECKCTVKCTEPNDACDICKDGAASCKAPEQSAEGEEDPQQPDPETIAFAAELTGVTLDYTGEKLKPGEFQTVITLLENYTLPETITVEIDGTGYIVYTDGTDRRPAPGEGQPPLPVIPKFDPSTYTLTIQASLLTEETKSLTIIVHAVEKPAEQPGREDPTEPSTEPPTEAPTDPAAEPETQPPTDPVQPTGQAETPTEPSTEPSTEPATEPGTEPATEGSTEPSAGAAEEAPTGEPGQ